MTHLKRKLMMTLALLLTAVTGAWAESKPIGLNVEYAVGDVITTNSTGDVYVWWGIYSEGGENYEWFIKISSSVTPTISELRIVESSGSIKLDNDYALYDMNGNQAASSYIIQCQGKVTGTTLEKVYVASGSGTLTDPYVFAPGPAAPAATPVPLTWDAATPNTATLTNGMPAGNVTVSVEYFPQAEFAMSTGETPVALAPTAIADVPATTDGPIVTPGTVKNIGTSEVKQGTLMYYVSTTEMTDDDLLALTPDKWSADVPTAADLAQGAAYVYYYIKGAEPATIAERTDANTCSDGDILAANVVNVTLAAAPLWNAEFDLTNAPEEDKAPGVWSTDIPEGGVVKGTPVKVTYTGKKKVIGVKAEKKAAEPVADIIWDGTNVTDLNVESTFASYTKEGVKLSGNADEVQVKWNNSAYLGTPGMEFITMESGGFTFTAPTGKKFTKIEMKAIGSSGWAQVNLGTGWAYNTGTVTWNDSAASTVKLLKDADMFSGDFISSIAFYLSE